jgi:hypothetical protein
MTALPNKTWLAIRRRYTWHLRPPFRIQFDRSHWWNDKPAPDIEPAAALYELARRHPLVCDGWARKITEPGNGSPLPPPSLHWTCLLGLKSWEKLDWTDRRNWESSVGLLKGLDFRSEDLQCKDIKLFAHWKIIDQREDALKDRAKTFEDLQILTKKNLATNPPTAAEWEAAIAQRAVEAHRKGFVLLAVAPDIAKDKVGSVLAKKYGEHLILYPPLRPNQRPRWENWLPLISAFENVVVGRQKQTGKQEFVRYRRVLDGIHFT